jgi:hypothetical protein
MDPVQVGDPVVLNGGFGCVSAFLKNNRVLVNMQAGRCFTIPASLAQVLSHDFKSTFKNEVES